MTKLEMQCLAQIRDAGLPEPEREYRFHPARMWRFDFAWPDVLVAVEVEGGVWSGGRHVRGRGFIEDCDKYNAAALLDWLVFRFTRHHLDNDRVVPLLREALGYERSE